MSESNQILFKKQEFKGINGQLLGFRAGSVAVTLFPSRVYCYIQLDSLSSSVPYLTISHDLRRPRPGLADLTPTCEVLFYLSRRAKFSHTQLDPFW